MAWMALIATAVIANQMDGPRLSVRWGAKGALADELAAPIHRTLRYGNDCLSLRATQLVIRGLASSLLSPDCLGTPSIGRDKRTCILHTWLHGMAGPEV